MRNVCIVVAVLLSVFSGAAAQELSPPGSQGQSIRIQGSVRTSDGGTLRNGILVRLEGDDGHLVAERPADSDGAFYFDGLHERRFRLVVTATGFESHEEVIELAEGIHLAVSNVTLKLSPRCFGGPAAYEPRSDALAPKNAKKEFEKATKELEAQHLDKAQTHLESAISLYPCYARAQAHLATVLEARHQNAAAESALKKAIECDPDYLSSYILLGQLLNDQKRYKESLPVLEAGERRSPSSWQICYQLGVAHFGLEQYADAEREYEKVHDFNPAPPVELPLRLADIHLKEKIYDKAYAEMKQYLQADPNGPFAAKVRGLIQQMDAAGISTRLEAQK